MDRRSCNADAIDVEAGDTLDFVADIGNKLSYNQFLWKAVIRCARMIRW